MKKKKFRSLSINKQRISALNGKSIVGGVDPNLTRGCPQSALCQIETMMGCDYPSENPDCHTVNQACETVFCQSEIIICVSFDICPSREVEYTC